VALANNHQEPTITAATGPEADVVVNLVPLGLQLSHDALF
jgi:hypothetical protein